MTRHIAVVAVGALVVMNVTGCKGLLENPTIPEGTQSPTTYYSRAGGLAMSTFATHLFREATIGAILDGGLLTDELSNNPLANPIGFSKLIDERLLPDAPGTGTAAPEVGSYSTLQKLRGQTSLARAILERYASDLSPAIRGRLYALEAYAVTMLAEQFCPGVPLSTLDFNGDYTFRPSSTLPETYEHAVALFDSALAISNDSANVMLLARVGKARALVGMGRLSEANTIVQSVKTEDTYVIRMSFLNPGRYYHLFARRATVSDREGLNGLPYRSSGDPRSLTDTVRLAAQVSAPSTTVLLQFPKKYATGDSIDMVVASGIEARLIQAEYQLKEKNTTQWLSILNQLRTDGTYSGIDTAEGGHIDTLWNVGTGGIAGLGPLQDPRNEAGRVSLMFRERAYWLFLTGQRLPDLRRMVRQYGRDREEVFPTGLFENGTSTYGEYQSDINMPIPWSERKNYLFHGCLNRDQ